MNASTLQDTDSHFLARMDEATAEEQDAIFADLAARSLAGDELATRTIRALLLPSCECAAVGRGKQFIGDLVDAAYDEVVDWAVSEGHATR
jgi:hypothetical protein